MDSLPLALATDPLMASSSLHGRCILNHVLELVVEVAMLCAQEVAITELCLPKNSQHHPFPKGCHYSEWAVVAAGLG